MQAGPGKNYFELFGIPARFELDATDLASRYRDLQRHFHPDRFASASETDRRRSVQMTAEINAAYQTLRDTVARARYLLALQGIRTDEETDTRMDPDFLVEQMELREELDAARELADRTATLTALQARVERNLAARTGKLRDCFAECSESALREARQLVREMQFLRKLNTEIEALD